MPAPRIWSWRPCSRSVGRGHRDRHGRRRRAAALIIDAGAASAATTRLQSAEALQALGYDVAFGDVTALDAEHAAYGSLRAMGVEVLKAPYHPSLVAAIKAATPVFDIIQISPAAASYLSPETIRGLSPKSRTVIAMDEAAVRTPRRAGPGRRSPLFRRF